MLMNVHSQGRSPRHGGLSNYFVFGCLGVVIFIAALWQSLLIYSLGTGALSGFVSGSIVGVGALSSAALRLFSAKCRLRRRTPPTSDAKEIQTSRPRATRCRL